MKKILLPLFVMAFAFVMQSQTMISSSEGFTFQDTTFSNPNGRSELAQLMRDMQQYTNDARIAVQEKKTPAPYPKSFDKIRTAKVTPGTHKNEYYDSFSDLYIASVKSYIASSPADRVMAYNNMVSGCVACHTQHCPGPMPVIKKMMLPTGK
jgi:hypothetical protein